MLWQTIKYYLIECALPLVLSFGAALVTWLSFYIKADVFIIIAFIGLAVTIAWLVVRSVPVMRALWCQHKCIEKVIAAQKMKGILAEEGGNRTGKSLDGFSTLFYKAISLEEYVGRFTKLYRAKKLITKLCSKEFLEFREINATYKFYQKHPELIPPLVTNVKVTDRMGRESMELTGEHLIQQAKLPQPCAVGLDESRDKVNNDIYKDQDGAYVLTNFARLFNQYTGDSSLFVFMEQNSSRAFHGYRDSLLMIKSQKGVKVLLEPVRLMKKLDRYYKKLDGMEHAPPEFAIKVLNLHNRIKRIGVLQLNFTLNGNRDTTNEVISNGIMQEYLPCDTPFHYDNRFFRTGYLCRNDEIKLSKFKGDLQSEEQVDDLIRLATVEKENVVMYRGKPVRDLHKQKKAVKKC